MTTIVVIEFFCLFVRPGKRSNETTASILCGQHNESAAKYSRMRLGEQTDDDHYLRRHTALLMVSVHQTTWTKVSYGANFYLWYSDEFAASSTLHAPLGDLKCITRDAHTMYGLQHSLKLFSLKLLTGLRDTTDYVTDHMIDLLIKNNILGKCSVMRWTCGVLWD